MSKAEIIAELARLTPEDRAEVQAKLDELAAQKAVSASSTLAHSSARIRTPRLARPAQARDFIKQVNPAHAALDASRYDPPAPVAVVSLRPLGGEALVRDVSLLIDTGADVTLLPRSAVASLGITPQPGMQYELIGFDGVRSVADAVDLEMVLLNKSFRGRYLLTNDDHGILGRDVLSNLKLQFDGPAQEWSAV